MVFVGYGFDVDEDQFGGAAPALDTDDVTLAPSYLCETAKLHLDGLTFRVVCRGNNYPDPEGESDVV